VAEGDVVVVGRAEAEHALFYRDERRPSSPAAVARDPQEVRGDSLELAFEGGLRRLVAAAAPRHLQPRPPGRGRGGDAAQQPN
jgi:hypothetical protein